MKTTTNNARVAALMTLAAITPAPKEIVAPLEALMLKDAARAQMVTKGDALVFKAMREHQREVDFVASTASIDAHDEIIDQESWNLLDYRLNPVVLYGHQSRELPIGQCTMVEVTNGQLVCTIRFASAEANPMAEQVWQLIREKVLRAVSVGFSPSDARYEMRDGQEVFVWYGSKLKEISVVSVPANPDALAKMKAAFPRVAKDAPAVLAERPVTETPGEQTANQEKESTMDAATQKLIDDAKAKSDALSAKVSDLTVKQVELETRAEKAEAKLTVAEKATESLETKVKGLESAAKTLEAEHTKACTDRDAAIAKAVTAEGKLVEVEVDALIGVKIAPAEKETFVELRKTNEGLFQKMVAGRPDMKLGERVTAPDALVKAGQPSEITPTPVATGAAWNEL